MKTAIIGYGYVGKAYHKVFPDAVICDIDTNNHNEVNKCDLAIVCVPTPSNKNGSCDISIVEEVLSWLKTPNVLIKSTVIVGTTKKLQKKFRDLNIAFSPEFIGEGNYYSPPWKYPDPKDPRKHDFFIVGGEDTDFFTFAFLKKNPHLKTLQVDSDTAEMIKYMVNSWIATKVTFVNEMYEACRTLGVPFTKVREGWLMDSRIERTFSAIFPENRGFGGKCIPKDVAAIIAKLAEEQYDSKFFIELFKSNERFKTEN